MILGVMAFRFYFALKAGVPFKRRWGCHHLFAKMIHCSLPYLQIRHGLTCMGLDPLECGAKGSTRQIVWDRIASDLLPLRRGDILRKLWRQVWMGGAGGVGC